MPRVARVAPGGVVFHVLNRANGRATLFDNDGDYRAFERILVRSAERVPMRTLSYSLMPNHWHVVLWPYEDGDLPAFMHLLTTTHVRRWRLHRHTVGLGHVYQGTYKSFPVQSDEHLLTVCRYVERNPVRARLVERAERWPWGSAYLRELRATASDKPLLADGPADLPSDWIQFVNQPLTDAEIEACRESVRRGRPFGDDSWTQDVAKKLGLQSSLRQRGRPHRLARKVD
jgi:putative transposase